MRGFKKISFEQFKKDFKKYINEDKLEEIYNSYKKPERATNFSAGYDIFSLFDFTLKPGEEINVPTGFKVYMNINEFFAIYNRSSNGFKFNVRMRNQVGIIDHDFYDNPSNEGHFSVALKNEGDKDWVIEKGKGIAQGIFQKYFIADNDDYISNENTRNGGIGSTDIK